MPEVVHGITLPDLNDLITPEDATAYFGVIEAAFHIHLEKEELRRGLWKRYPAKSQVDTMRVKVDRLLRSLETLPSESRQQSGLVRSGLRDDMITNMLEELHDIINYAVFAARILRGEQWPSQS